MSERKNERSGAGEQSEQCGAREWVAVQANERVEERMAQYPTRHLAFYPVSAGFEVRVLAVHDCVF